MLRCLFNQMHSMNPNQIISNRYFFILLLGALYFQPFISVAGNDRTIDSLLFELETELSDTVDAEIMLKISKEYFYTNTTEAIRFANQALELFRQNNNKSGMEQSLNIVGAGYYVLGNYKEAEAHFREVLNIARHTGESIYTAKTLNNLANIKLNTGQLVSAIDYFKDAGIIFAKKNNLNGVIAVENSLSSIYRSIGSYAKAHRHLKKALLLAEESKNNRLLGTVYHNLGALLIEEGRYDEAYEASINSYTLRIQEGHLTGQIKSLINLGSIFYQTDRDFESDTCYKKALLMSTKYGYIEDEAYILMHLGYLQIQSKDYQSASGYLYNSMKLAENLSDLELQMQLYDYLYYIDSVQENFETALIHLQQYNKLKLKFDISDSEKDLKELESLFKLVKNENKLKENIIHKNRSLIFCLIIGLIVIVLLTVLFIQQIILSSQRKIAELAQENLRSQMNPHFIFNILNSIHSFILSSDTNSSSIYLLKFSHLLRLTLDNSMSKLVPIYDELDALKLYLELESMRFNNQLEYEIIVDEEIDPLMFKIPTLLLQPYVENSIVHGLQSRNGKGKIEIRLDYENNGIHCSITDNGIGMKKAENLKREKGITHKSHGSKMTETRLKLLNTLYGRKFGVKYTELLDENDNCKGTKVEFNLPILN